jgi:hypothetical protein
MGDGAPVGRLGCGDAGHLLVGQALQPESAYAGQLDCNLLSLRVELPNRCVDLASGASILGTAISADSCPN